jgi:hypothetical protein
MANSDVGAFPFRPATQAGSGGEVVWALVHVAGAVAPEVRSSCSPLLHYTAAAALKLERPCWILSSRALLSRSRSCVECNVMRGVQRTWERMCTMHACMYGHSLTHGIAQRGPIRLCADEVLHALRAGEHCNRLLTHSHPRVATSFVKPMSIRARSANVRGHRCSGFVPRHLRLRAISLAPTRPRTEMVNTTTTTTTIKTTITSRVDRRRPPSRPRASLLFSRGTD